MRIAQLAHEVPIMCVSTTTGSLMVKPRLTPDWPTGRWMEQHGLKNDGLVPTNSAILPCARHVTLEGLAHGEVATRHMLSRRKFEHIDLLKALFAVTLAHDGGAKRGRAA